MPTLSTLAESLPPAPLKAMSRILSFTPRVAGFVDIGELEYMMASGATVEGITRGDLTVAVYAIRLAARTVNGKGGHDEY